MKPKKMIEPKQKTKLISENKTVIHQKQELQGEIMGSPETGIFYKQTINCSTQNKLQYFPARQLSL